MRRDRQTLPFVVLLGVGLLAAAYAIWVQGSQIRANQALIKQQQRTVDEVLRQNAEGKRELEAQQRLIQALQRQVQKLGGTPLLIAPSAAATPRGQGPNAVAPTTRPTAAAPRPTTTTRPTPAPTGSPSQSPTPRPSSSATCRIKVGTVCL